MFLNAPPKPSSSSSSLSQNASQANNTIPKPHAPQSKPEALHLYSESFRHLNRGISNDENHRYTEASECYITAMEIISVLLSGRGDANSIQYLSQKEISNLKKHQSMFMDRLQELENLRRHGNETGDMMREGEMTSSKMNGGGWMRSLKGLFSFGDNKNVSTPNDGGATDGTSTTRSAPAPIVQQQQYKTPVFNSFRKRSNNAPAPQIYKQTHVDDKIIDLTRDNNDPEEDLIRQAMDRSNLSASMNNAHTTRAKPELKPRRPHSSSGASSSTATTQAPAQQRTAPKDLLKAPELKGVDKSILNRILDDVIESSPQISFDDVGGLDFAKQILRETVIFPQLRPDLFDGLRTPTKGILLNGPPGTGKTLLARCVASNVKATFFNVSASSLVSKYHGEGEKIAKALFAAARLLAPSVIFIDEVDSVLTARSESEHEASRRLKTQILIELDGIVSGESEPGRHLLVMAATNRPHELDDAALRRFPKRIFIPLPDANVRKEIIKRVLKKGKQQVKLSSREYDTLASLTEGFSGSDLNELCKEAVMQPIRELGERILNIRASDVRSVQLRDFEAALQHTKPTANKQLVKKLEEWNREHGSGVQ
uniref:microtubule-severing ATPase n=1 Tax=Percolomonas cosmopolitus TaxID=63605 RepID=A0A7S1KUE9_9EUKA